MIKNYKLFFENYKLKLKYNKITLWDYIFTYEFIELGCSNVNKQNHIGSHHVVRVCLKPESG